MKKRSLLLCVLCGILLLSSCSYRKNATLNGELLEQCGIAELPLPPAENTRTNQEGSTLYVLWSDEEYRTYLHTIVEYLSSKEGIWYFGVRKQYGLVAEMLPNYVSAPITDDVYKERSVTLCYSLTEEVNSNSGFPYLKQTVILTFKRGETKTLGLSSFEYNTVIYLKSDVAGIRVYNGEDPI